MKKFALAAAAITALVTGGIAAAPDLFAQGAPQVPGAPDPARVTLEAEFTGAGTNPMNGKETVGFEAETEIRRSDFNVNYAIPLVSDEVELEITIAFEKQ